jgi:hypothetical protein
MLDQSAAPGLNPDFDPRAFNFWSSFLASDAQPVLSSGLLTGKGASPLAEPANQSASQMGGSGAPPPGSLNQSAGQTGGSGASSGSALNQSSGQTRGSGAAPASPASQPASQTRGSGGPPGSDSRPVFLHFDSDGFGNAAELDASKLIPQGDVSVSLNSSTIRVAAQDLSTFDRLQNAQIRLDFAQRNPIVPEIEAMAYTVISGMVSSGRGMNTKLPAVQSVSPASDQSWQKMRNIILPGGEGRWALNLEAQKKDSLFCKVLQTVVQDDGQFTPMIGLPGVAMSALQSFNILYGALHAAPVRIIESKPLRVFATQEAIQRTGAPGSATGIMLKSGTYILTSVKQAPAPDQLKNLTIMEGRIVPINTPKDASNLDAAAADTLKGVTYLTFDVQVRPKSLSGGSQKKSNG